MAAGSELKQLKEEYPDLEIETVEAPLHPVRTWKDGVRIYPATKIGDDILAGIFLTRAQVRMFVEERIPSQGGKAGQNTGRVDEDHR